MKIFWVVFLAVKLSGATLLNLEVQRSWDTQDHAFIYSAGVCRMSQTKSYYYEGGLIGLPSFSSPTFVKPESPRFEKAYTNTLFGFYAGYHLFLFPIFRPGLYVGTTLKKEDIYQSETGKDFALSLRTQFRIDPYFALSLHAGMLSLILSNYGIGGGINVAF